MGLITWQRSEHQFLECNAALFRRSALRVLLYEAGTTRSRSYPSFTPRALSETGCIKCPPSGGESSLSIIIFLFNIQVIDQDAPSQAHILLVQPLADTPGLVLLVLQRKESGLHSLAQFSLHSLCDDLPGLVFALLLISQHDVVHPSFEEHAGLLFALGCSYSCEFSQRLVISPLGLQGKSNQVRYPRCTLAYGDFLEIVLLRLLPKDDLDLTEISLLSVSSAPSCVTKSLVSFSQSDHIPMHPEPRRVQPLTLGVVDQVVKSPHEYLCHFSM